MPNNISPRTKEVQALLRSGESASSIAKSVGTPLRRVFAIAQKYDLPTNPPIVLGGGKWNRITQHLALGYSKEEVAKMHRLAVPYLEELLEKARAKTVGHSARHP